MQGEAQQKLDVYANDLFIRLLRSQGEVCAVASEENDDIVHFDNGGKYVVSMDPLDGSSNIDVNVSIGTIFSIYRRVSKGDKATMEDFMQPGTAQVAAGYIIYGSSTMLVLSLIHISDWATADGGASNSHNTKPISSIPRRPLDRNMRRSYRTGNLLLHHEARGIPAALFDQHLFPARELRERGLIEVPDGHQLQVFVPADFIVTAQVQHQWFHTVVVVNTYRERHGAVLHEIDADTVLSEDGEDVAEVLLHDEREVPWGHADEHLPGLCLLYTSYFTVGHLMYDLFP